MAHYFTADTHFGDDPVRRIFARPFSSVADMDAGLVTRAGAVGPDDDLWILGDFAAVETEAGRQAARAAFTALPGRKHLIRGNHDLPWTVEQLPWASIHDLYELRRDGQVFVLCHYPLVTWNGVRDGAVNLFGHVHTNWRGARGQVNVGVDQWDFKPLAADEAELAALLLPPSPLQCAAEGL